MKKNGNLENNVSNAMKHKYVKGFSIHVHHDGNDEVVSQGNLSGHRRFYAASVTKLFVTAMLLMLVEEKKLSLDDKIIDYIGDIIPENFHTFKGKDYTRTILIKHLMSNTSGLPDYFDKEVMTRLLNSEDEVWGLKPVIEYVKDKEAYFIPGHPKKAKYCDTNYQLLGAIIEKITNKSFSSNVDERILKPLNMHDSYMYDGREDPILENIYYKDKEIILPNYLASIGPEGGLVSTSTDLNRFLQAFFNSKLFDSKQLEKHYTWRLLLGPGLFFYGIGISMQPIHLFKMKQGIIGHWGHSGAFAFYHPKKNVYMTGSVNQFVGHNQAAKVMLKVLKHIKV